MSAPVDGGSAAAAAPAVTAAADGAPRGLTTGDGAATATGALERLRIAILDDTFDTLRTLPCFRALDGHDVVVHRDHTQDLDALASRLADADVRARGIVM